MSELDEEIEDVLQWYRKNRSWAETREVAQSTSKAVRALAEALIEEEEMGTDEMTTLCRLCENPGAGGSRVSTKKNRVRDLDISDENKERVLDLITKNMGSINGSIMNVEVDDYKQESLDLLRTLVESDNKNEIDSAIEMFASLDIDGIQSGTMSPIFHYLHPKKYPINNGRSREGMTEVFGEDVSGKLSDYVGEIRKYQRVRDEYGFNKHYRDLDLFLAIVVEKKPTIDTNLDDETRYFWVNTEGKNWTKKFYSSKTSNGNPRRKEDVFEHASEGDKVAFFGISPLQRIVGFGKISEGMHDEEHEEHEEPVEGITVTLEEPTSGPDWGEIQNDPQLQDSTPVESDNFGFKVVGIREEEYERLAELAQDDIEPSEITGIPGEIQVSVIDLHFPDDKEDEIIGQITRAIENGNHVLLVGPPGTGKSKLAKAVCESVVEDSYEFVTATSDWTTFDTVGGYHPEKDDELVFKPGVFLSRFKNEQGNPQNEWLVVDEINRADIDKAFGALFSVLAGDDATLSFTDRSGRNIRILCNGEPEQGTPENVYYVPDDWRMVATMNTLDKTSLYEMSYAFMRRWAFVSVPVPEIPEDDEEAARLVGEYVDVWKEDSEEGDEEKYAEIAELWRVVNRYREIGPAIVEDIYEHVEDEPDPDYASALSMYVIPQLEGLRENELADFVTDLSDAEADVDVERVEGFVEDYFQVKV